MNLCALLVGVALSLIFLEVALRVYNPIMQTVKGEGVVLPVNYDVIRQNRHIPGLAPESHIHQNSLGFRGADPPGDVTERLSIITIGGSTTQSAEQSDDRTWTALLGNAMADCFDHTWINNAGFGGHTTFAHLDLIRNHIIKLHPKVVVMLIGANELFAHVVLAEGFKGFVVALANRSEVVDLGLTLFRSFRAWRGGLTWGNLSEGAAMPSDGDAKLAAARGLQSEYAERLHLIIRLLRDAQTIPVLMTQPTVGGIGRDPTTGKELSHLWYGQFLDQTFGIYNDTMRHVAQSENVYLIDLAHSMPKDTKYYFDLMHFTDVGAEKVAELVATGLLPYLGQKFPSFNNGTCRFTERWQ